MKLRTRHNHRLYQSTGAMIPRQSCRKQYSPVWGGHRFASLASVLVLVLLASALSGCARSVRSDAKQVAQVGSTTAEQIGQIYEAAQQDVTDTFELNQFYRVYADPNATVALTDNDRTLFDQMEQTNRVLGSRVRLAQALKRVYVSYARLSDYNNATEMEKSVGDFIGALNGAAALPLLITTTPAGTAAAQAVGTQASGLLKAIANEIGTVQQNRALIREGKRLIPLLERLRTIFDAERKLLAYEAAFQDVDLQTGKPKVDAQGRPVMVMVSGIAGDRVRAYKRFYQELVQSNVVVSQPLLDRFLAKSALRWPDANQPFTERGMKAGVIRLIELDAYRRGKATDTAGAEVINGVTELIALHQQLANKQALSLQEALQQSALAQFWIGELKKREIPTDTLIELLQAIQKIQGGQP